MYSFGSNRLIYTRQGREKKYVHKLVGHSDGCARIRQNGFESFHTEKSKFDVLWAVKTASDDYIPTIFTEGQFSQHFRDIQNVWLCETIIRYILHNSMTGIIMCVCVKF